MANSIINADTEGLKHTGGDTDTLVIQTNGNAAVTISNTQAMLVNVRIVASTGLYENPKTISADYTITTNNNALSAGPVEVATGVNVTVPGGSVWTVV